MRRTRLSGPKLGAQDETGYTRCPETPRLWCRIIAALQSRAYDVLTYTASQSRVHILGPSNLNVVDRV